MKIYIGSDHRGLVLKKRLTSFLEKKGHRVVDVGNFVYDETDDYTDFGRDVALGVTKTRGSLGIAICGSGSGVCVAANKVRKARAFLALNEKHARITREDDDANVLCLGADFVTGKKAEKIALSFLRSKYKKTKRRERRIEKLGKIYDGKTI